MTAARSLNTPLFSDDDFTQVEQDVREAMALKARDTSMVISSAVPKAEQKNTSERIRKETSLPYRQPSLPDEAMVDVEDILKNLLNSKQKEKEPISVTEKTESKTEPLVASRTSAESIPDFLRRDKIIPQNASHIEVDTRLVPAEKNGISWKVPYAIIGAALTILSIVFEVGVPTLSAIITMAPLVDPKFYKKY